MTPAAPNMSTAPVETDLFADEFRKLTRYLTGMEASGYQQSKYAEFRRISALEASGWFDAFLDAVARSGFIGLALSDAYSGTFYRGAAIQKKLAATLAILECSPPSFGYFDAPGGDRGRLYFRIIAVAASGAIALLAASFIFALPHLCAFLADRVLR